MDAAELLKRVRRVEITTRKLSDRIFSGEYSSAFKGRGMAFAENREYQPGDEVRTIDWNVTARYNHPYVKIFEEERELTMMLAVDVSGSEFFGTQVQLKKDTLTEIAATLAFSAIQNNDKVGLILFSDQAELFIPPKKGKSHVLRIIRELIEFQPRSKKTNIDQALKYLSNVMTKKAIVFILSDFRDDSYAQTLKILGKKHDVTGVRIYDKHDETIPNIGMVTMRDAETGKTMVVNTASKSVRTAYNAYYASHASYCQDAFSKSGSGVISTRVDESYVKKLLTYFKQKGPK